MNFKVGQKVWYEYLLQYETVIEVVDMNHYNLKDEDDRKIIGAHQKYLHETAEDMMIALGWEHRADTETSYHFIKAFESGNIAVIFVNTEKVRISVSNTFIDAPLEEALHQLMTELKARKEKKNEKDFV